jgi:hypothetical protein
VQHWAGGAGHKHRHGKAAAAAAAVLHLEDPVEFREWRQDEARYAQHGLHGRDRRR